ncbi:hypothetical protein H0H87_011577 [Tephrocybe sp. NHM501043]|nr:hypothetical protein H0H87_011577 [Tephrocybe sp. NHM501043]
MASSTNQPIDGTLEGGLMIKPSESFYTTGQITTWLSSIHFPHPVSEDDIANGRFPTTLQNLTLINRLFLVAVPYENTMMHYSADHFMDISAEGLYQRIAIKRQGYRAYSGAGRVNVAKEASDTPIYTALSHMIIFVQPGDTSNVTYLVDVGCGGSGPTRPILLSSSDNNIVMGTTPTEKHRLTRGTHPESKIESSTPEWHLDVLHIKGGPELPLPEWRIVYAFSEKEFFPTDFDSANFAVCRMPGGYFWDSVICSKHFWLNDKESNTSLGVESDDIATWHAGRFGMDGAVVRKHIGSNSDIVRTLTNEAERAEALHEFFGIRIEPSALEYIRGRVAALLVFDRVTPSGPT